MRVRALALSLALLLAVACTDDVAPPGAVGSEASSALVIPAEPVRGGTLRLGIERVRSFDPAAASPGSQSELLAADLLYDGLPALAASVVPSEDLKTWTFTLRDSAVFANGRPVAATDVKFSFERLVKQGVASLAGSRLEVVRGYGDFLSGYTSELAGLVVVGERTLSIELNEPLAVLPDVLSAPAFGIVASEALSAGSGPFRVVATEGDLVRLAPAVGRTALLDGIELHQYDDLDASYDDFVAERLDWSLVPSDRVSDASGFTPFHAELFYAFNLLDPLFADVRFRQAIVKAIDRTALVESVYPDVAVPLNGVVPVGVEGHVADPCGVPCAYDPAASRALLAEAFPPGEAVPVPTVHLDFFEGTDEEAVARFMESALVAVGVPVVRRAKPAAEYDPFAVSGLQQLFRFGWIGVYPSADAYLAPLFGSRSRDNATGFMSPDVDGALAAARSTADPAARAALYQQAEAAIMAQAPIVPIAQFKTRAVVSPRVQALSLGVGGTFDATKVWLVP